MTLPRNVTNMPLLEFSPQDWALLEIDTPSNHAFYEFLNQTKKIISKAYYDCADATQKQWMDAHERLFRDYFRRRDLAMSDFVWAKYIILQRGIQDPLNNANNVVVPIFDLIKQVNIESRNDFASQ